jgi:hypothetical protein
MSSPPGLSVSGTCVASDSLAGSPKVDGTYRNVRYLPRTFLSKNYTETNGTQAGSMELVFAVLVVGHIQPVVSGCAPARPGSAQIDCDQSLITFNCSLLQ